MGNFISTQLNITSILIKIKLDEEALRNEREAEITEMVAFYEWNAFQDKQRRVFFCFFSFAEKEKKAQSKSELQFQERIKLLRPKEKTCGQAVCWERLQSNGF